MFNEYGYVECNCVRPIVINSLDLSLAIENIIASTPPPFVSKLRSVSLKGQGGSTALHKGQRLPQYSYRRLAERLYEWNHLTNSIFFIETRPR